MNTSGRWYLPFPMYLPSSVWAKDTYFYLCIWWSTLRNTEIVKMNYSITHGMASYWPWLNYLMMTSSNGNILRITGHLCWEFTGSPHKGQWRGALMFSLICVWINGWVNNREARDLRCYRGGGGGLWLWCHSNGNIMLHQWTIFTWEFDCTCSVLNKTGL